MTGHGNGLVVERGHGSLFGKGRYASPVYGRHFVAVLDLMERLGLVWATKGFRYNDRFHGPSTICATPALAKHLPLGRTERAAIARDPRHEVLILKARKSGDGVAGLIDYTDTADTNLLRRQVRRLNARLESAPLSVLATIDAHGRPIDETRRTVTRVFNNGSWSEGGRLGNGPFWADMSRADRFRLIRIGGECIVAADYSQLLPRLAYAAADEDQPNGDLYDVRGDGLWRDGWKQLVSAELFSKPPGLRNWPQDCRWKFGPNPPKLAEAISAIKTKHAPIAHLFGTGIGYRLLKTESDMLLWVLESLHRQCIEGLPVHDAVLVARQHCEAARSAMQAAAARFAGIKTPIVHLDFGFDPGAN